MYNKDLLQDGKSEADSDWIDCRTLMGWKPRDNWWKHDNTETNEWLTQKQQRLLGECLDEAFAVARQEKVYNWTLYVSDFLFRYATILSSSLLYHCTQKNTFSIFNLQFVGRNSHTLLSPCSNYFCCL